MLKLYLIKAVMKTCYYIQKNGKNLAILLCNNVSYLYTMYTVQAINIPVP